MSGFVLGFDSNPGGRKYNEDRADVQHLTTGCGTPLAVAVLADGVGGEERGERAAQLAIDAFLATLRGSDMADPLKLLVHAVKQANFAVYVEARRMGEEGRMACTLVAAIAQPDGTLHIANAGDARIYLCRDGQLVQLSRDHNFVNVMVWMGKLSAEAAAANPDANKVMRVLGVKPDIQADVGFYDTTTEYGEANRIGRLGMKLKTGDSVLLCSDGLVKPTPATQQTLITDSELERILKAQEGDKAARAIMSIALGRIPIGEQVDNITVALLQTEDPARAANLAELQRERTLKRQREQRRKMLLVAVAVAVPLGFLLLLTMGAFAGFFAMVRANTAGTATRLAEATSVALAQTQTVEAYTPTPVPSATPVPTHTPAPTTIPTAVSGEIAKVFNGIVSLGVITDDRRELLAVPEGETRYVAVTYLRYNPTGPGVSEDGNVYLAGETRLQFGAVTGNQFQFTLLPGSDVMVQTGPYPRGVEIHLADTSIVVVGRGCLSLTYLDAGQMTAGCYDGECSFSTQIGASLTPIGRGTRVRIPIGQSSGPSSGALSQAEKARYWNLLSQTSAGRGDIGRCQLPNVAATAAAQTATSAAATQKATLAIQPATLTPSPVPPIDQPPPPTPTPLPPPATPTPIPSNTALPSNTPLPTDPPTPTTPAPTNTDSPTSTPETPTPTTPDE